jgi:polysaccharide biosynthesis transport protein
MRIDMHHSEQAGRHVGWGEPSFASERAGSRGGPATQALDLRLIALAAWRYKRLIVTMVVVMTGLSYVFIESLAPRYQAEASLVLDIRRANVGIDPVIAEMRPDDSVTRSEVDVLRSRWLARRVVQELGLVNDPEFNPALRPPDFSLTKWLGGVVFRVGTQLAKVDILPSAIRAWLAATFAPDADIAQQEGAAALAALIQNQPARPSAAVIEAVLGRLTVLNDGRSYTVDLYFDSEDPEKAARIVNSFADLYLGGQVESKYDAAERGAGWLENKIEELRVRVRATENTVLEYRRDSPVLGWGGESILTRRMEQFSSEMVAAQSRRVLAETRLSEIQRIASTPLSDASVPALTQWPELDKLLVKVRDLQTQISGLRVTYGEHHPLLVAAKAELDRESGQFAAEVARIVGGLESEVHLAKGQEDRFVATLQDLEAQNVESHRDEAELRRLESEAAAARSLYETFLGSLDRTAVQLDLVQPDARVLSLAEPPPWPSYPQKRILMALTVIAALGLSLVLVAVLEFMHKGFRAAAQVEEELGVPVLGMIPLLKGRGLGGRHPSNYALQQPFSTFTESIHLVRSTVDLAAPDQLGRVVLVTSAVPDEGKTALALTLGRLCAASGQRPLLIDCDLRSPSVAADLGATAGPGVSEILLGEAKIHEVLCIDQASDLTYIPAGRRSVAAIDLLRSGRMADLIKACRPYGDTIILDSPPVALVSDPVALCRLADTTLMVVRWDRTPRALVAEAIRKLHGGTDRIGVVLSRVNLARYATYGFGDFPHAYLKGYLSD